MTSFSVPKPSNYISDNWIFNEWIVDKGYENKISKLFKFADIGLSPVRYLFGYKTWVFVESEGKYYFSKEVASNKDTGARRVVLTLGAVLLSVPSLLFVVVKLIAIASKTIHFSHPSDLTKPLLENRADSAIYEDALKMLDISETADERAVKDAYISIVCAFQRGRGETFGCIRACFELLIQDRHHAYFTIMKQKFSCNLSAVKQTISDLEKQSVVPKGMDPSSRIDPARIGPSEID